MHPGADKALFNYLCNIMLKFKHEKDEATTIRFTTVGITCFL